MNWALGFGLTAVTELDGVKQVIQIISLLLKSTVHAEWNAMASSSESKVVVIANFDDWRRYLI